MPLSSRAGRTLATVAVVAICALAAWLVLLESRRSGAASGPPPLWRGPQVGSVTMTSAVIAWKTDPAVRGSLSVEGAGESWVFAHQDVTENHVLPVAGLKAGTRYSYAISSDGKQTGAAHSFTTAPAAPAPFRFVAIGDSGSGSDTQIQIASLIARAAPDFLIHTGDVNYDEGEEGTLNHNYFGPYRDLIDHIPFYLTLGNHDVKTDRGRPLLDAVPMPTNDRTHTRQFYSWDWSNGHFVCLNTELTYSEGSPQLEWLKADLAGSRATWKVAFFHKPPYTSSRSSGEKGVQTKLCPLFEQHHVDLVFGGHDHDFERSFPIVQAKVVGKEGDPDYVDPAGPIYIVTGGGGKSLYEHGKKEFTAYSASVYHYTRVDVNGTTLTLTALGTDDKPFDRMSIRKTR